MCTEPLLEVYCISCLRNVPLTGLGHFQCPNGGPRGCPMPYEFEVLPSLDEARKRHDSVESWMPKYYFQPLEVNTGRKHDTLWCVAYNQQKVDRLQISSISDMIQPSTLLLLESGFGAESGRAVSIIEPPGRRLEMVEPIPGLGARLSMPANCAHYCRKVRAARHGDSTGNQCCIDFDQAVIEKLKTGVLPERLLRREAFQHGDIKLEVYAYICWAGLVDYVCPVYVDGHLLAVVFTGQLQLVGDEGQSHLQEGMGRVHSRLAIPMEELEEAASRDGKEGRLVRPDDLTDVYLSQLAKICRELVNLARDSYYAKRQEREDFFLREISHIIETQRETAYGIKSVHPALRRLQEFFGIEEAYFLLNRLQEPDVFEIVAKASAADLNNAEEAFSIRLDIDKLRIRDRISVFGLMNKPEYDPIVRQLTDQLPHLSLNGVWAGSCPLVGISTGFWLFVNPLATPGARASRAVTPPDKRFLSKFCAAAHDVMGKALASVNVMRCIGHELGAGIQAVISNEEAVLEATTLDEIRELASTNLSQMHKTHCLVENLRNIFVRAGREVYVFKPHSITRPVMDVYDACIADDELKRRRIDLRKPVLRGRRDMRMHLPSLTLALFNLFQNAIKYSFDDHFIETQGFDTSDPGERSFYCLEISNFGVGITEDEIAERLIFKQDYRGILAHDRNRSGTGLGLAIVERAIKAHGGRVEVKSMSAIELDHRRKHGTPLPKAAVNRLVRPGRDLEVGFLTVFSVYLPLS